MSSITAHGTVDSVSLEEKAVGLWGKMPTLCHKDTSYSTSACYNTYTSPSCCGLCLKTHTGRHGW